MLPGYDPFAGADSFTYDEEAGETPVAFFRECLTHVKGKWAGQPLILEPWQESFIRNLFGWKRADGTRRYRQALMFVPRKNGKTAIAAGICLYVLNCDNEPGAEIYGAAHDYKQACLVFQQARGMVLQEPVLEKRCKIFNGQSKAITREDTMSAYKPLASVAEGNHGLNTHLGIIDELHAQAERELYDVIKTSMGARRQPLLICITTSDYSRPESICNELHDYASKVRDGVVPDLAFLPCIYEAKREDDWTKPEIWAKANPNIGVSISEEFIAAECEEAKRRPAYENTFKRLQLNIRTEQAERWIDLASWDACGEPFDEEMLLGRECFAGLDLAASRDISALSLVFKVDETYYVLPFFWAPEKKAWDRKQRDRVDYVTWAQRGFITLCPGDTTDFESIRASVNELRSKYMIRELAFDRWQAADLTNRLKDDGLCVEPFGQGYASMSVPTKRLDKLIAEGRMRHGGNPILRWMAANVSVVKDSADNWKPCKKTSGDKIDGITATIMALGRSLMAPQFDGSFLTIVE